MLFLTENEVRELLRMDDALDQVERSLRNQAAGSAFNRPRQRVIIPGGAVLHVMAAGDAASGYLALKAYSTSRQQTRFLVLLYAAQTGEPLAQMEADYLGQVRTGAASGVASRYLARAGATTLALIGTGKQALTQAQAVARVRPLQRIRVYGRNAELRQAFAARVEAVTGVSAEPAAGAREAVEGADIICTATTSREPVVNGEWLGLGVHINAIGANSAARREVDDEAVLRSEAIVTDSVEQARIEAGELIHAFREEPGQWDRVIELSEVVAGKQPGRTADSQITLFKSNGIALEDVAVAGFVFERARAQGVGREIPVFAW